MNGKPLPVHPLGGDEIKATCRVTEINQSTISGNVIEEPESLIIDGGLLRPTFMPRSAKSSQAL